MTVDAPARAPERGATPPPRRLPLLVAAVGGVLIAATVLHFWTKSDLWLDEAQAVNIARLPLSQLHNALTRDGAPPLYYVLLHFWIRAFGTGDLATRSLSGLISLATLPLAWFAGNRLGGKRVAWVAVLVLATSPYAIHYATEARMYSLVMGLVLAGYLAGLRALERPTIGRLTVVVVAVALLMYSQYWSFYLLAVAIGLLVWRAWRSDAGEARRAAMRVVGAIVVGALTFVPWLPTFLDQSRHTGTPWGNARVPWSAIADAMVAFAGTDRNGETYILVFALLTLIVFGVFGRGVDGRTIQLELSGRPEVRREAILAFGTILLGTSLSFVASSAFDPRYASVMYPIFALLVAVGVSRFLSPKVQIAVVGLVVIVGLVGGVRNATTNRTQASQSTSLIAAQARPGDVVAYCPDQVGPAANRLLAGVPGLIQITYPRGIGPQRVDWVDYIDHIDAASPQAFAAKVLQRAGPHTIWYVYANGYNHFEGRCEAIAAALTQARPRATSRVTPDDSLYEFMGLTVFRA